MKNTKNILTLLAASFILLASSFTFSSCKDCGKKEPEPTDRDNKTSTEGDNKTTSGDDGNISANPTSSPESDTPGSKPYPAPKSKKELTLSGIKLLVEEAAEYAVDAYVAQRVVHNSAWFVNVDVVIMTNEKVQEVIAKEKKVSELAQRPDVVALTKGVEKLANNAKAIGLLSVKMEREVCATKLWVAQAARMAAYNALKDAQKKDAAAQAEAQKTNDVAVEQEAEADAADTAAGKKWDAVVLANSPALEIVRAAFMKEADKKGMSEDDAKDAFES